MDARRKAMIVHALDGVVLDMRKTGNLMIQSAASDDGLVLYGEEMLAGAEQVRIWVASILEDIETIDKHSLMDD